MSTTSINSAAPGRSLLQGETEQRMHVEDIYEVHVRHQDGALVPMRTLATVETVLGPGYVYAITICAR